MIYYNFKKTSLQTEKL